MATLSLSTFTFHSFLVHLDHDATACHSPADGHESGGPMQPTSVLVSASPPFLLARRPRARVRGPSQSLWRLTERAEKRTTHTTEVTEADGVRDVFK